VILDKVESSDNIYMYYEILKSKTIYRYIVLMTANI